MNEIVSPSRLAADRPSDDLGSYGTRLDVPLEAEQQRGAAVLDDQGAGHGSAPDRDAPATDRGDPPAEAHDREPSPEGRPDGADKHAEPPPPPPSPWIFAAVGLLLAALLALGIYRHWSQSRDAKATQEKTAAAVPEVRVAEAKLQDKTVALTLPGQTAAFATANIYPRATGYITERRVDIGSRVKKGDLLIHITAPDLDQQLAQAVAQLGQVQAAETQAQAQVDQAEANLNLAKVTLARTNALTQQGYETLQNRDNQVANQSSQQATVETARAGVKVADANTKAQQATIDRLKALTAFEDVRAPFDGVVTVRNVDLGDLVNADSAAATPMFTVAQDNVIRVTVQVPQNSAVGVRDGLDARVEVPQMPGETFKGKVARSSVALVSSARTLTTEVDIPNPDGRLRAGLYVYVTTDIPREHPAIVIPAETLIFDQHGMRVAAVEGEIVKLRPIKIERDFGTTIELRDGLKGGEKLVLNPPTGLRDGAKVTIDTEEDKNGGDKGGANAADSKSTGGQDSGGAGGGGGQAKQGQSDPSKPGDKG